MPRGLREWVSALLVAVALASGDAWAEGAEGAGQIVSVKGGWRIDVTGRELVPGSLVFPGETVRHEGMAQTDAEVQILELWGGPRRPVILRCSVNKVCENWSAPSGEPSTPIWRSISRAIARLFEKPDPEVIVNPQGRGGFGPRNGIALLQPDGSVRFADAFSPVDPGPYRLELTPMHGTEGREFRSGLVDWSPPELMWLDEPPRLKPGLYRLVVLEEGGDSVGQSAVELIVNPHDAEGVTAILASAREQLRLLTLEPETADAITQQLLIDLNGAK